MFEFGSNLQLTIKSLKGHSKEKVFEIGTLKGQLREIFDLWFFSPINPT
jgi:hypothetical protein